MRSKVICSLLLFAGCVLMLPLFAQEGHPLTGTWYGDWGPTPTHRNQITVVMSWDGKNVTGIINPGPDVIPIKVATLDSTKWTVRIEADAKDQSGNPVHFIIDGKIEDVTNPRRSIVGTWNHGAQKGDFKIVRDN